MMDFCAVSCIAQAPDPKYTNGKPRNKGQNKKTVPTGVSDSLILHEALSGQDCAIRPGIVPQFSTAAFCSSLSVPCSSFDASDGSWLITRYTHPILPIRYVPVALQPQGRGLRPDGWADR